MSFTVNRSAPLGELLAPELDTFVATAAGEYSLLLIDELERGTRTGEKYPQLPYQSSAYGEPEQEQEGELRGSVNSHPEPDSSGLVHVYSVGFYDEDMRKLYALEVNEEGKAYRGTLERILLDNSARDYTMSRAKDAL